LFEESQEAKETKGLGILRGEVVKFKDSKSLKVPHMGWNELKLRAKSSEPRVECPLLRDLGEGSFVYFCHSYYPDPQDSKVVAAWTSYGHDFASFVWKDNCFGVQFHPEKSQGVGLKMLKNFVEL
jgi:glutamine amidotransferase